MGGEKVMDLGTRSHRPLGLGFLMMALVFATLIGLHPRIEGVNHARPEWLGVEGLTILRHIPLVALYIANGLCWGLGFTLLRPDTH